MVAYQKTKYQHKMYKSTKQRKCLQRHTSSLAIYGAIQILICFVTLIVQYTFVSYTEFKKFTEMHAETVLGTLIMRSSFGMTFAISGCFGIWASHKQSVTSILSSLVAGSITACFCLVYMVESAICVMHMVREIEQSSDEEPYISDGVVNIKVEIGSGSSFKETNLENRDLKLRLMLFTTQLIACLIQAVIVILVCSSLNRALKRNENSKYFLFTSKKLNIENMNV